MDIQIQRIKRPSSRLLEIAGVTPYSNLSTKFKGANGKIYQNFIALAKASGANCIRLEYDLNSKGEKYYKLASECKKRGMKIICTIHPGKKFPNLEKAIIETTAACEKVITMMHKRKALPEIIFIGNEINTKEGHLNAFISWKTKKAFYENTASTLKAAIKGLRQAKYKGLIGLHIDRCWAGFFEEMKRLGVKDFQVAGLSLYPKWEATNKRLIKMHSVATKMKKKILILETAAPYIDKGKYATQDFDEKYVTEVSPNGQAWHLQHVCDLVLSIPDNKGMGVLTWGSDLTIGIHKWDHVTWNRAQVTKDLIALPSLKVFEEYTTKRAHFK
jgi:arabinogalactan endo-1,4-beta-galactosidase